MIFKDSPWGFEGKAGLIGYFTGKISVNKNGFPQVDFTEVKTALMLAGKVDYTHQKIVIFVGTPIPPIPAYVKIALEAEFQTYWKWKWDKEVGMLRPINRNRKEDLSFTLSPEGGVGLEGHGSVGIKGSGTVRLSLPVPNKADGTTASLEANLMLVATTLNGIAIENTPFSVLKEHIFWDGSLDNPWAQRRI